MIMKKFSKAIAVLVVILTASLVVPETTIPYFGTVDVQAATKLSKTKATLIKGQTLTLKLGKISSSKIKWTSSKKSVATISSKGKITAKRKGTATITAKYKNKKYTCKVTVEIPKISKTSTSIYVGSKTTLKMSGTKQTVKWSSSKKSVATVSSKGVVTGKSAGTAKITAKIGSKSYACSVTVKDKKQEIESIPINSISLNKLTINMKVDETDSLSVTVYPSNTTSSTTVTWDSSDSNIVIVDYNGNVQAVGVGTAVITASVGDKCALCIVTVKEKDVLVTDISIDTEGTTLALTLGDNKQLVAYIAPTNALNKSVKWESSDPSVATIDQNGYLSTVGIGYTTITVSALDGSGTSTKISVQVNRKATLTIQNILPSTFSYYIADIKYSSVSIKSYKTTITNYYSLDTIGVRVDFYGEKTYDKDDSGTNTVGFNFVLYDSSGNIVESGFVTKAGLSVGRSLSNAYTIFVNVPIDDYTLVLSDKI